jgi:hypothetical protein
MNHPRSYKTREAAECISALSLVRMNSDDRKSPLPRRFSSTSIAIAGLTGAPSRTYDGHVNLQVDALSISFSYFFFLLSAAYADLIGANIQGCKCRRVQGHTTLPPSAKWMNDRSRLEKYSQISPFCDRRQTKGMTLDE